MDLIYNPAFAAAGQLEDLTDWAKSLPYFNSLSPSHVRLGTYQDRVYGLPLSVETSVFAWNKDLYKKTGLDPEKRRRAGRKLPPMRKRSGRSVTIPTASISPAAAAAAA